VTTSIHGALSVEMPLPTEIQQKLPNLQEIADAARAEQYNTTDDTPLDSRSGSAGIQLGILGAIVGAFVGYLMRPAAFGVGQLDFETVISRGSNLHGLDQLLVSTAEASFNGC
jgi:hypothetical protein